MQYSASSLQRGLIVNNLRGRVVGVDIIQVVLTWPGVLDRAAFAASWQGAAARHDALRTGFGWHGTEGLVQTVHTAATIPIRWLDTDDLDAVVQSDRGHPFNMADPPLLRLAVLTRSDGHSVLLTLHHAILDGRSLLLLLDEFFTEYTARLAGTSVEHPVRPPYSDFIAWAEAYDLAPAKEFWSSYLDGCQQLRPLPGYLGDAPNPRAEPTTLETEFTMAESTLVRQSAQTAGVTVNTMVNAAWAVLRSRYAAESDVTFAVTRSSRQGTAPGAADMIGLLINTVPLRLRANPDETVAGLLADAQARIRQVREHQLAPYTSILQWTGRSPETPLADSLVVFERQLTHSALAARHPLAREVSMRFHRLPSYPATLYVFDEPRLQALLIFDRLRLLAPAGERMLTHFRNVLLAMARDLEARVSELQLADASERELLRTWQGGAAAGPAKDTIPELFATQVARTPDAVALTDGTTTLTYAELDQRADRLAWLLRASGVDSDVPVAVALPRGIELIVALLAIAKAGGAYVPLDPADPAPRTSLVVRDSGAALVLTPLWLEQRRAELERPAAKPPPTNAHPLGTAYVSYTSGSTGVPKGVVVPHRAVVRLVRQPDFAELGPGQTLLHLAPTAFDASTLEIWGALLTGAKLALAPPGPLDLGALADVLRGNGVTVLWLTSGLFHQVVELDVTMLGGVRQLLSGGDVLTPDAVRSVLNTHPGLLFVNGYGPTENTTFTTCHRITDPDAVGDRVPIGRPIQDTTAYVLDMSGRPVPIGVVGELYTGGGGLARGYLGSPALTADRFVPDPFGTGGRLYRTGDMVRWRADGVLEFIGRADQQVKIRGFRVEPGEVETVLRAHPQVRDAAVLVRDEGADRHLVAFVTAAGGSLAVRALHEYALRQLPAYLVPTEYAILDRLPLNANGKVDRAALPEPERPIRTVSPPSTPAERRLAALWRDLLQVEPGLEDDFFTLGGNSLAVTRLLFRIREAFGVELPLARFYDAPTLAGCVEAIEACQPPDAGHLIELTEDWALWRTVCLRGAGMPFAWLSTLGDPTLADLADTAPAELFRAVWPDAVGRLSGALYDAARNPVVREAVAWQGRHALHTGFDPLVRRGPQPSARATKHRQHEALVASYLQRYCAKNDTIGFFGPVGWASFGEADGVTASPGPIAKRTVHLEGWAVSALLEPYTDALAPFLVPRLMPFLDMKGDELHVPMAAPIPMPAQQAAVLRACDGVRTAHEIAANLGGDVYRILAALARTGRIAWRLEASAEDIHPERTLRQQLLTTGPLPARQEALAALDEIEAARDALAAAAGDADLVARRVGELESAFTRHTGVAATRRPGELYAGRTLVYEECLRGGTVEFGVSLLDGIRTALGIVLDAAHWFTAAAAALWHRTFLELFGSRAAELGRDSVPLAEFWLLAGDMVINPPEDLVKPLTRALNLRWSRALDLPPGGDSVQLSSAGLKERASREFAVVRPGWVTAVQHSPDLMLVGEQEGAGQYWVLGELHPGINTMRYHSWVALAPDPDALRAAHAADIGTPAVYPGATGGKGGTPARQGNAFAAKGDLRLMFAHDTCAAAPAQPLPVGRCDVVLRDGRLTVRSRDGRHELALVDVLGDLMAAGLVQHFRVVPRTDEAHTPRVTIDQLVVSRESWKFRAGALPFATVADEPLRYMQTRAWARAHGLPRHVFLRTEGESKPIYLDLTSVASVDLLARAVRRAGRHAGPGARVSVTEMLPGPDQLWLQDANGQSGPAELRVVAVRRTGRR